MMRFIMWALGTGFVTGAVWMAIVLWKRQPREASERPALPEGAHGDPDQLAAVNQRLLEVEERLDYTEQRLREKVERLRKQKE
jgi:hypothetical protein